MKRVGIWFALLVLLTAGCVPANGKPPKWDTIQYSLSGGIAGFDQQLSLDKNGSFQITNRGKQVASGKLTEKELNGVKEAMAKVDWSQIASKYIDPRVADAMFDGVTVTSGNKQFSTVVGTGGAPPEELSRLMGSLRQILTDHRNG